MKQVIDTVINAVKKLIFKNRPNKSYNTEDGTIWNSRSVAVVGIVILNTPGGAYILLGKRGDVMDEAGKWNIPCGYLDWDENLYDALRRELWEECGLDLLEQNVIEQNLQYKINTEPTSNRQNVVFYTLTILDQDTDELPVLSLDNMETNEATHAVWVPFKELMDNMHDYQFAFDHESVVADFTELYKEHYK